MDRQEVFEALAGILRANADGLVCVADKPGELHLDTAHRMDNGRPLFFGAVRAGKAYVSFHLMPVYVHPPLLAGLSPALRKRMQGKSCFNFTRADPVLWQELSELTRAGYAWYVQQGYI